MNKVTLINLYLYQLHLSLLYALLPDAPLPLQSAQLWKTFVCWSIVIFEWLFSKLGFDRKLALVEKTASSKFQPKAICVKRLWRICCFQAKHAHFSRPLHHNVHICYSSPHLVVERMEELIERTSLEESGWRQRERWFKLPVLCSGMVGFGFGQQRIFGAAGKEHPSPPLPSLAVSSPVFPFDTIYFPPKTSSL